VNGSPRRRSDRIGLLIQHGERMENDPGYRDAFDHLVKLLSAKKGPVGENVQLLAAIQEFLTKAL
jgi:hypothetical protein